MPRHNEMLPRGSSFLLLLGLGCSRELEPSPEPLAFADERSAAGEERASDPVERSAFGPGEPADARPAELEPSAPLSEISGEELLERIRRSGRKGAFVNVWATFCGPCKRELPLVQKLAPRLEKGGVEVVLVSVDVAEDRGKAAAFLNEHAITLPSYLARRPLGPFKQALNPRWPGMVPASFLYDATGRLRYYFGGEAFEEELTPVLDAFLAGQPIEGEADFIVAPGSATAR